MSVRRALVAVVVATSVFTGFTPAPVHVRVARRAVAIDSVLRIIARRVEWPGYTPLTIPLAVYDGDSTFLFRHPSPPLSYHASGAGWSAMAGRDTNVTANSSALIGEVTTATLMIDRATDPFDATAWAAVALHEAFHVFQRTHHRTWVGNEGDLLLYPFENAERLALRRLETEALRRAELATSSALATCWALEFVRNRQARYATLDSASRTYERLTELNEGLANYVQVRAGARRVNPLPLAEFDAQDVRKRVYSTGPAMGGLLDRLSPQWKQSLERDDRQSLDVLLDSATRSLGSREPHACRFSAAETQAAHSRAKGDSLSMMAQRDSTRRAFDDMPGWHVVIRAADGAPLWPQGFDPSNLQIVRGGLLHTRFVALGNASGKLEAMRSASAAVTTFTVPAGAHPLFNGVRLVEVVGIGAPAVDTIGDTVRIAASGLTLRFTRASVTRDGERVLVQLRPGN